ncbi:hypothetical protein B0H66DRAFT_578262 [Apodospora peruviana]|uniref:ubiquitinyl hydrolase 1 n=1 Tax=Apodospora peruviana TaxID=516989 RepID=A0AAE0HUE1_9PEZI|nr:hypothetical protein B0H66DRAFT_578262 [Apodospora peruviana]
MDELLLNHLALSAQLPHQEDPKPDEHHEVDLKAATVWESICRSLVASKAVNPRRRVNKTRLLSELRSMTATGFLLVHIHTQNAALLIHQLCEFPGQVVFEVFEAAPRNEDVLAADNALQWDFPGSAVAVPLSVFNDEDFQVSLATFLEQASLESTKAFAANAFKAGEHLCYSMLMAILEENGRRISTPLPRKRVRDDICWNKADKPWRRLPHWLVLRVAVARYPFLALGGELGRFEYKFLLCCVFGTFLEPGRNSITLPLDKTDFMKIKLCRRLVKLDVDRNGVQNPVVLRRVDHLFEQLSPRLNTSIQLAIYRMRSEWGAFKKVATKSIPLLPTRAAPSDTTLPLRVSGEALRRMQAISSRQMMNRQPRWTPPVDFNLLPVTNVHFSEYARPFLKLVAKEEIKVQHLWRKWLQSDPGVIDLKLSQQIKRYIDKALPLPARTFPLLRQYHPVFTSDTLDVLHLAGYDDMVRLQNIQEYLHTRTAIHGAKVSVFDDPSSSCFALRYYNECSEAVVMHALHQQIEEYARQIKHAKLDEWSRRSAEFQALTKQVDESTCISTIDEHDPLGRSIHVEGHCPRCRNIQRLNHMRIRIYEHPLPSDDIMAKVAVFELICPPAFSIYRDTTYMVLSRLGCSTLFAGIEPKCILHDYSQLSNFSQGVTSAFTLASVTKSFLKTHYAMVRFPVEWEGTRDGLVRPNGLKLAYYDMPSGIWTGRARLRPTFAHHVRLQLPPNSPFQSLLAQDASTPDSDGPSSCPSGVNPNEFLAFQTLMSGSARRWLSILVELGSNNLSLSSEAIMALLTHQTCQSGPRSEQNDPLRLVHSVFRDTAFVEKLLEQIESRLSITANWRETHLMNTIITLAAIGLGTLIVHARECCISWTSEDQHALAAALLCRRTFVIHLGQTSSLDPLSLETYIESSIAIQENMTNNINSLTRTLLHDLPLISQSIADNQEDRMETAQSTVTFLSDRPGWTEFEDRQLVLFDIILGTLLNSLVIKELFGNHPLRVFQSPLPGMAYTLTNKPNGFHVHVGDENGTTVVVARAAGKTVRLVPRDHFYHRDAWDLPMSLILGHTGDVYIAPLTSPWTMARICRKVKPDKTYEDLVDPCTPLFNRVTKILDGLALRQHLLVSQPSPSRTGRWPGLEVKINQKQLMFFLDAGTWYGLKDKLVCRRTDNRMRRIILVPLGGLLVNRSGPHVMVRFVINDVLGRIECAAEPLLVYTEALLHAYTSFLLPDSLEWLKSGICHPWTVIDPKVSALPPIVLKIIASLTPLREYYPPGKDHRRRMKVMKTDRWNESLTCHIQHPAYRQLVREVLEVSDQLGTFSSLQEGHEKLAIIDSDDGHLTERAWIRRELYERKTDGDDMAPEILDRLYVPRDRSSSSEDLYGKAIKTVHLLRTWPDRFETPANISPIFAQGNIIGGYGTVYDKLSPSTRMHTCIRENWGSLVELCRSARSRRYTLMFLFATLAFRSNVDENLLKALAAFAIFEDLRSLPLPSWPSYFNYRPDVVPQVDDIARLIQPFKAPPPKDDADELERFASAKQRRKLKADRETFSVKSEEDYRYLAKILFQQWPCAEPSISDLSRSLLVDVGSALEAIRPEWLRLYQNMQFSSEFKPVKVITSEEAFPCRLRGKEIPGLSSNLLQRSFNLVMIPNGVDKAQRFGGGCNDTLVGDGWTPLASILQDIHQKTAPRPNRRGMAHHARPHFSSEDTQRYINELRQIVEGLTQTKSLVRKNYAHDLLQSIKAFEILRTPQQLARQFLSIRDYSKSKADVLRAFGLLKAAIEQPTPNMPDRRIGWLKDGNLFPAVTTVILLEQLRTTGSPCFESGMRKELVSYALALTRLQRDIRLNECVLAGDTSRFQDEEANVGHTNWTPDEQPDWLLLEIESNLLIRPDQVDVARATIMPASRANSVLQMNMGRGKTSCIIPMVVASMANRQNLVRVIVPKALLLQTAQLLQSRLGGILNRHVRHIPFSRRTPTHEKNMRLYLNIHKHMLKTAGVILCLPEHNLSFMLSGQQRLLDKKVNESVPMIKIQSWLKLVCRDVLDESDYTLATGTQFIYPSGSQTLVDGSPHQWQVIETILRLVDRHLYGLATDFPNSIVVQRRCDGFPFIYFLRQDAEDELLSRLTADIMKGFGDIVPMQSLDARYCAVVRDLLKPGKRKLKTDTLDRYGLTVKRDPIAVPFHAKGVASEQSEWGHPDVAILFTCLAFYYDGVNESPLKQALERVVKSDDPSTEYDIWSSSSEGFPESLRSWSSINVDDDVQVNEIWKAVRYQVVVIDYFLNNFVFPHHAKQFKVKLQSNGWDIPLFSTSDEGEAKSGRMPLTTGFSGTNDSRTMLPLTIKQEDLAGLSHTNAEVLSYLLHDRSRRCEVITDWKGGRATERDLLLILKRKNIGVLIDAGAQILEMDNETLAKTWLKIDGRWEAAGRKTPLLASPYADDLTKCLTHTRGTDFSFPLNCYGAVTVGQGQSKDHTLGTTQSVMFLIPPEVCQVIRDIRKKDVTEEITSPDVIHWLLDNACNDIEQLQPLYFSQGTDFCRRTHAVIDNPDYLLDSGQRAKYVTSIKQNELQTLQELYEPKLKAKTTALKTSNPKVAAFVEKLNLRRKGFHDNGRAVQASALQEVEQEREVAHEVECVRQVKKPFRPEALSFPGLHRGLETLARTGRLSPDSSATCHVFNLLSGTFLGRNSSKLFLSAEFERTARFHTDSANKDSFLRPVNWIIWSGIMEAAVVVIPEEAEIIIRMACAGQIHRQVYLITYASPVTRKMLPFNSLSFFSMPQLPFGWVAPAWLKIELGILAGRLYFEWDEYETLCKFLGVDDKTSLAVIEHEEDDDNDEDNPVQPSDEEETVERPSTTPQKRRTVVNSFSPRPLTFLQEWLAVRRHGQDFAQTPMGFLTQGKPLQASHPFFSKAMASVAGQAATGSDGPVARIVGKPGHEGDAGDVEGDVFDGVDDMGANCGHEDDGEEHKEVVYDDSEYYVSASEGDESD